MTAKRGRTWNKPRIHSDKLAFQKVREKGRRRKLSRFIVANPRTCHGKPTYKGTRIMVGQVLARLAAGESAEKLARAWGNRISREAIRETIGLAKQALLNPNRSLENSPAHPIT